MRADVLKMTIWQTPAGILDEGGMLLGAWLNFGLSLEAPPANGLMHVSPTSYCCWPNLIQDRTPEDRRLGMLAP